MSGLVTQKELAAEPLLLHIVRGGSGICLPGHVFRACPIKKETLSTLEWRDYASQLTWERLCIPLEELKEVTGEGEA